MQADLRARRVFTTTRIQMESAMAFFNWAGVAVGVVLALHHVAAAGVVYLILFYATFVGTSLEESFEFIRLMSRAIGRCAKFAGIALTEPDIVDAPGGAGTRRAATGGSSSTDLRFAYRDGAPLFDGLDLSIEPGEHVGLVGPSGSGKTTLTKLLLRFADRDGGVIAIDGQDIAQVTQHSLRRHIAYVPQDPQMLHRTIAENICYGQDGEDGRRHGARARGGQGRLRGRVRGAAARRLPDTWWASAGSSCRAASASVSPSPRPWRRAPRCWCSTRPPRRWTRSPSRSSKKRSGASWTGPRHWWWRTAWPPSPGSIASWSSTRAAWSSRAPTPSCLARAGVYCRLWEHQSGGFLAA